MNMEEDKSDDETFLVSSDTESECGDEKRLFYDEESDTKMEVKCVLRTFDRDNGGQPPEEPVNIYQETIVPKLMTKGQDTFIKWLLEMDLLSSEVKCPNSERDPKCAKQNMKVILAFLLSDKYQLRCMNCRRKESIRKNSIFEGVKCNLRSFIRILYGWVKGIEVDIMANILGLPRKTIGTVYNRASNVALATMMLSPRLFEYGGDDVLVLVDIFPMFLKKVNPLSQRCQPVLCISEIETIPQKFWLESLPPWNPNNPDEVDRMKCLVLDIVTTLVKPGTILVLPCSSTLSLDDKLRDLEVFYPTIKQMDDLLRLSDSDYRFQMILNTIWRKPTEICEEAQYFSPNYVGQYFIRKRWSEVTCWDSFLMLVSSIIQETRKGNIKKYCNDGVFNVRDTGCFCEC